MRPALNTKSLLSNKSYRGILLSNVVNRLGDSLDTILFTWLVYSLTNSATWSAIIFAINQGTSVLLQPLVGPVIDKKDPKRAMILSDIVRVGLVLILIFTYILNLINPLELIIVTILISASEAFHMPAATTIVQHVLSEQEYDKGISLNVSLSRMAVLIGTAISGTVIAVTGLLSALILDISAFMLSVIFVYKVAILFHREEKNNDEKYLYSLKTGLLYLIKNKELMFLCLECILINSAVVPFDSLLAPIASEIYGGNAMVVSLLSITVTIGTIFGAILFSKIKDKYKNALLVAECGMVLGIYYIVLVYIPNWINSKTIQLLLLAVFSIIIGIALGIMITYVQVTFIKKVEPKFIGRITSIRYSITYFCAPIVAFIIGCISTTISTKFIFIISGSIIILLFGVTILMSKEIYK